MQIYVSNSFEHALPSIYVYIGICHGLSMFTYISFYSKDEGPEAAYAQSDLYADVMEGQKEGGEVVNGTQVSIL